MGEGLGVVMDIQDFRTAVWHEGYQAYNNGVKEYWNPYVWLTDDHNQWSAGWHWAQDENTVPAPGAVTGAGGGGGVELGRDES